jgi:hypothetical protein
MMIKCRSQRNEIGSRGCPDIEGRLIAVIFMQRGPRSAVTALALFSTCPGFPFLVKIHRNLSHDLIPGIPEHSCWSINSSS